MNISSIAQSGMQAAQTKLSVSANNVANERTAGFRPQRVEQETLPSGGTTARITTTQAGGTNLHSEVIQQNEALYAFKANLRVIQTEQEMLGLLLDRQA